VEDRKRLPRRESEKTEKIPSKDQGYLEAQELIQSPKFPSAPPQTRERPRWRLGD
jgi:hypothetical protein